MHTNLQFYVTISLEEISKSAIAKLLTEIKQYLCAVYVTNIFFSMFSKYLFFILLVLLNSEICIMYNNFPHQNYVKTHIS